MIKNIVRRLLGIQTTEERDKLYELRIAMMGGFGSKAKYFNEWGTIVECKQCGWTEYSRYTRKNFDENDQSQKCSICRGITHDRKATKEDYRKYDVDGWYFADNAMWRRHLEIWNNHHIYVPRMTMKEFWELSPEEKLPTRMKEIINDHTKETT